MATAEETEIINNLFNLPANCFATPTNSSQLIQYHHLNDHLVNTLVRYINEANKKMDLILDQVNNKMESVKSDILLEFGAMKKTNTKLEKISTFSLKEIIKTRKCILAELTKVPKKARKRISTNVDEIGLISIGDQDLTPIAKQSDAELVATQTESEMSSDMPTNLSKSTNDSVAGLSQLEPQRSDRSAEQPRTVTLIEFKLDGTCVNKLDRSYSVLNSKEQNSNAIVDDRRLPSDSTCRSNAINSQHSKKFATIFDGVATDNLADKFARIFCPSGRKQDVEVSLPYTGKAPSQTVNKKNDNGNDKTNCSCDVVKRNEEPKRVQKKLLVSDCNANYTRPECNQLPVTAMDTTNVDEESNSGEMEDCKTNVDLDSTERVACQADVIGSAQKCHLLPAQPSVRIYPRSCPTEVDKSMATAISIQAGDKRTLKEKECLAKPIMSQNKKILHIQLTPGKDLDLNAMYTKVKLNNQTEYKCNKCDVMSREIIRIKEHYKTSHLGMRNNYKCDLCGNRFGWRSNALKHIRRTHFKTDTTQYITIL